MNPFHGPKTVALATAIVTLSLPMPLNGAVRKDPPAAIRGAIYVPTAAYNAPQMWKNFSVQETRRDFGYAREIHLNALRIWASYEYWKMEPAKFQSEFDQLLGVAHHDHIRILISLFENDGVAPTPENMWTTDPTKALDIQSPGKEIASPDHKELWEQPRQFIQWFMKRYGNNDNLLAIEVMNEPNEDKPGKPGTVPFAKSMFTTAKSLQGTVPLTIGSARIAQANEFVPLGLDVMEFHDNFPPNLPELTDTIKHAMEVGQKDDRPVWFTEWQRLRPGGSGFKAGLQMSTADKLPDYASLAPTVHSYPIANFFWSLMIKRAYLPGQRKNGTINGLFWPDGAVESLKDARAIAADPKLDLRERPIPPNYNDASPQ